MKCNFTLHELQGAYFSGTSKAKPTEKCQSYKQYVQI